MDNKQIAEKLLLEATMLSETAARLNNLRVEEVEPHDANEYERSKESLRRQVYRLMRLARIIDPKCTNVLVEHLWGDVMLATTEDGRSRLDSEWQAK